MATVLCWFHQDLRLADHPALDAAIADGHAVIPLYILDDTAAVIGRWAGPVAGGSITVWPALPTVSENWARVWCWPKAGQKRLSRN